MTQSAYEKDRMIPQSLGQTTMGRDLLAQDYLLKQLTASLIYPQQALGKTFWAKVYAKAKEMYGTTQMPVNTFNKVWIVPQRVGIYEHNQTAYIINAHLKVMLEEDYLSLRKHNAFTNVIPAKAGIQNTHSIASNILRQIILPEIEKEVNEDQNFATLRQIFYAQALAVWFKQNLKQALLNRVYANKDILKGIKRQVVIPAKAGIQNQDLSPELIYRQYLKAYKKGVFNFIQQDSIMSSPNASIGDPVQTIPRKYFSGGYSAENFSKAMVVENLSPQAAANEATSAPGAVDAAVLIEPNGTAVETLAPNVATTNASRTFFSLDAPIKKVRKYESKSKVKYKVASLNVSQASEVLKKEIPHLGKLQSLQMVYFLARDGSEKPLFLILKEEGKEDSFLAFFAGPTILNTQLLRDEFPSNLKNLIDIAQDYLIFYRSTLPNLDKERPFEVHPVGSIIDISPYNEEAVAMKLEKQTTDDQITRTEEEIDARDKPIIRTITRYPKINFSTLSELEEPLSDPELGITYMAYIEPDNFLRIVKCPIAQSTIYQVNMNTGQSPRIKPSQWEEIDKGSQNILFFIIKDREYYLIFYREQDPVLIRIDEAKKIKNGTDWQIISTISKYPEIGSLTAKQLEQPLRDQYPEIKFMDDVRPDNFEESINAPIAKSFIYQINRSTGETTRIKPSQWQEIGLSSRTILSFNINNRQSFLLLYDDREPVLISMDASNRLQYSEEEKVRMLNDLALLRKSYVVKCIRDPRKILLTDWYLQITSQDEELVESEAFSLVMRELKLSNNRTSNDDIFIMRDTNFDVKKVEKTKKQIEKRMDDAIDAVALVLDPSRASSRAMTAMETELRKVVEIDYATIWIKGQSVPREKLNSIIAAGSFMSFVDGQQSFLKAYRKSLTPVFFHTFCDLFTSLTRVELGETGGDYEINVTSDNYLRIRDFFHSLKNIIEDRTSLKSYWSPSPTTKNTITIISIIAILAGLVSRTTEPPHQELSNKTLNPNNNNGTNSIPNIKTHARVSDPGGIDLSQEDSAIHVTKDANGGVKVDADPALIARVEREGIQELDPVIINMRPADLKSLFGVAVNKGSVYL